MFFEGITFSDSRKVKDVLKNKRSNKISLTLRLTLQARVYPFDL